MVGPFLLRNLESVHLVSRLPCWLVRRFFFFFFVCWKEGTPPSFEKCETVMDVL